MMIPYTREDFYDWVMMLQHGTIKCSVFQDDMLIQTSTPTHIEQLNAFITIQVLSVKVRSDFSYAYKQFVESGETSACYECHAYKTITKFGSPIQFAGNYIVQFSRVN